MFSIRFQQPSSKPILFWSREFAATLLIPSRLWSSGNRTACIRKLNVLRRIFCAPSPTCHLLSHSENAGLLPVTPPFPYKLISLPCNFLKNMKATKDINTSDDAAFLVKADLLPHLLKNMNASNESCSNLMPKDHEWVLLVNLFIFSSPSKLLALPHSQRMSRGKPRLGRLVLRLLGHCK